MIFELELNVPAFQAQKLQELLAQHGNERKRVSKALRKKARADDFLVFTAPEIPLWAGGANDIFIKRVGIVFCVTPPSSTRTERKCGRCC